MLLSDVFAVVVEVDDVIVDVDVVVVMLDVDDIIVDIVGVVYAGDSLGLCCCCCCECDQRRRSTWCSHCTLLLLWRMFLVVMSC